MSDAQGTKLYCPINDVAHKYNTNKCIAPETSEYLPKNNGALK